MTEQDLKDRTKQFALRVIKLVEALPSRPASQVLGKQLLRAATAVGANYRAACRGRSRAELIAKLGIVVEETDECGYWMELIIESNLMPADRVTSLITEADELTAIMVASRKSSQSKINNHKS